MFSINDVKAAFYSLSKVKGYVVAIVLTLGITLGALVAMFNVNYQLLVKPLPYPDQEQLYLLRGDAFTNGELDLANMYPYPVVMEAYKKAGEYFDQYALVYFGTDIVRSLDNTPLFATTYVTPEYLQLADVSMAIGRSFNQSEGLDSFVPVTVISYEVWQTLFSKSQDVLGKTLRFGEVDFKIIGVTSEDFVEPQLKGPSRITQVWLPWDYNIISPNVRGWGMFQVNQHLVGKLNAIQQPALVEQNFTNLLNDRYKQETAGRLSFDDTSIQFKLVSYRDIILDDSKTPVVLLFISALVLVLIAVTNIINLILARAANQQYHMAIKAALGAQKSHLFNLVFTEILLLILPAMAISLLVAVGGIKLLQQIAGHSLPRLTELHLSIPSIFFALFSALLLALLFSLLVSHQINYRALNSLLQASGKGVGVQISKKVRHLLILLQVMLTGVLITASLQILERSINNIQQPLGFASQDLYQVQLNIGAQRNSPVDEQKNNLIAIRDQLLAHPKVANASIASDFPISSDKIIPWFSYLSVDADFAQQKQALLTQVDDNFLLMLDAKIIAGRHFTSEDFQTDATAIIINETFAHQLQPDGEVLRKRYYWLNSYKRQYPYEIIGVVRDFSLPNRAELPRMFVPQASVRFPRLLLQLKPHQKLDKMEINELMARVQNQYKVSELISTNAAHQLLIARYKLSASIAVVLSVITLCLAAIGIYGVLSYSVQLRRFELGVRMAIGAGPDKIFWQIFKDNLVPVILGLISAFIILITIWWWIQHTAFNLPINASSWFLPPIFISLLTAAISLLSVWHIIRKPAIYVLRGN